MRYSLLIGDFGDNQLFIVLSNCMVAEIFELIACSLITGTDFFLDRILLVLVLIQQVATIFSAFDVLRGCRSTLDASCVQ